jgi:hypothetical protein
MVVVSRCYFVSRYGDDIDFSLYMQIVIVPMGPISLKHFSAVQNISGIVC